MFHEGKKISKRGQILHVKEIIIREKGDFTRKKIDFMQKEPSQNFSWRF